MAINSPRIVAGPTKPRIQVLDQRIVTHPVEPGGSYVKVVDGVRTEVTVDAPTREGQVYFHPQNIGGNRWANMYVGVAVDSVLGWVPVFTGEVVNTFTGLPPDPINDG